MAIAAVVLGLVVVFMLWDWASNANPKHGPHW